MMSTVELPNLAIVDDNPNVPNSVVQDPAYVLSLKLGDEKLVTVTARKLPHKDVQLISVLGMHNDPSFIRISLAMNRLSNRICNKCLSKNKLATLKICEGCTGTWYCSKECQEHDWETHKLRCNNLDGPLDDGPMAIAIMKMS